MQFLSEAGATASADGDPSPCATLQQKGRTAVTHTWVSPSGSRWEPTTFAPATPGPDATPDAGLPAEDRRRRGRQPVLVALVALLSLGAAGGTTYDLSTTGPAERTGASS